MRIAHVCPWFIPGLSYQENFLPSEQAKLGHEVWILTSDRIPPRLPAAVKRFAPGLYEEDSVKIIRMPSIMPLKNRGQVFLRNMHPALKGIDPDIVHVHGLWFLPTLQVMTRRYRCALVADDHADNGNLPAGPGNIIRFGFARWVCRRIHGNGGRIFSVNPFSRWFVTEVLRTPLEAVHFLPLGINTRSFYPDSGKRREGREKLNLTPEAFVFVTSGRLTSGKGFELLLEAFSKIHRIKTTARLMIIGSGSQVYESQLRGLAETLEIENAVIFLPWMSQEDLCTNYNAADAGVLPGKLGGIREILAVARPLIVPDHMATRYFVDRDNGSTFTPDNPSSLSQVMLRYMEDSGLRKKHGEKSLLAAREHLSWRAIAGESLRVYSEVIERSSKAEN